MDMDKLVTANFIKKKYALTITIEGEELEFSNGFTDLHTESYKKILEGNGFGIAETKQSIEIVHDIRHSSSLGLKGEFHPLAKGELAKHPFELK